jgi:membrane-bound lytic murein transglycosylase D
MHQRLVRACALVALLGSIACTHEKTLPPDRSGVYERIHGAWQDYEVGIDLILTGDEMAGRNQVAAATTRLVVAARECAETPGCDSELFTDAMEQLVEERRFTRRTPGAETDLASRPVAMGVDAEDPEEVADTQPSVAGATTLPAESLLTGADLEDLIPMNRRVMAALNDWLTWNRPALMEAYRNYGFLRESVAPVYEEAGLPEALLFAMMAKESGAKVHAYSRAGAAGPLQFMGRTGQRYGLRSVNGFDMRLDPVAATRANSRYMKDLLERFDGRLELALAAYNMGQTRLDRLRRRHRGADFWDPGLYHSLPWETRNYVPKVMAAAWLFLHPVENGLELPAVETNATTIALEREASLGELAVCLGQAHDPDGWFRTLRNLNPRMSPGERTASGAPLVIPTHLVPVYNERCGENAPLMELARALHDADYPEKPELMRYVVQRGDTLAEIAARHRCSLRELASMNGVKGPDFVIHVGQQLTVPTRG